MPTYMSRSVAGSYDNEAVAIFALVCAFYTYARSLRIGSLMSAMIATVSYHYMVLTWGGYVFILGLYSMYTVALIVLDRIDIKAYLTFSVLYVVGTMLSLTIPFLQDLNTVWESTEHGISHLAFIILQIYYCRQFLKKRLAEKSFKILSTIVIYSLVLGVVGTLVSMIATGKANVGHRVIALFNPTYSKKRSPLITSIDEHKAAPWSQMYSQIHYALFLGPLGVFVLLAKRKNSNPALFGILYCLVSIYFASVMKRLKLVAGPGCCVMGGIGISYCMKRFTDTIKVWFIAMASWTSKKPDLAQKNKLKYLPPVEISLLLVILAIWLLSRAVFHGAYESVSGNSEPIIVMSWMFQNKRYYLDDFRAGYSWIRQNTDPSAVVMSWWDTGYQLAGLGNRTTLNDNNTWNETQIGKISYVSSTDLDTGQ
jgi:dolichyl-diphosphooligosaccharide--protein glycosyltransferase